MQLRVVSVRNVGIAFLCTAVAVLLVCVSPAHANRTPGEPPEGLYLVDPSVSTPTALVLGEEDEPAWSPDGHWISALDVNDYYFNVLDASGGSRHRVHSFVWSNDGSKIAYTADTPRSGGPLFVTSSTWSKPRLVTRARHSDPLAWAPDNQHFVYGTGGESGTCCYRSLVVVTSFGRHPRTVLKTGHPQLAVWSPTGTQLAAVGSDQYIYVAPAGAGRGRRLPGTWGGFPDPEWAPDGKSFIVYPAEGISSTGGFDAVRVSVPSGARTVVCKNCGSFDFSPDHRSIAYTNSTGALWVANADLTGKRRLANAAFEPRWSPDGRSILVMRPGPGQDGSELALVDVATGQLRQLTDGNYFDRPLGVSADGRFVAFMRASSPDDHELWLVGADGTGLRQVMLLGTCSQARWAPTGALLAAVNLDDC
jgi:Tol biopolymer transport system component